MWFNVITTWKRRFRLLILVQAALASYVNSVRNKLHTLPCWVFRLLIGSGILATNRRRSILGFRLLLGVLQRFQAAFISNNNAPSPKTIFRLSRLKRIRQPETRLAKRNLLPAIFGFKPELSSQFIRHGIAGAGAGTAGAGADNGVKSVDDIQLQIQLVFADGDGLG